MGTTSATSRKIDMKFISDGPVLSIELQLNLVKPFTPKEIKDAMFSIDSNKSPGIDGFGVVSSKRRENSLGKTLFQV